jgi:hypothetical protein
MDVFSPDNNQKFLFPIQKLIDIGEVTALNIDEAKKDWKKNAKEEFQELINAEVKE